MLFRSHRQIEATNEMIAAMNKSLDILKYQLDKGYASGLDYNAQKAATAAAAAHAAGQPARDDAGAAT